MEGETPYTQFRRYFHKFIYRDMCYHTLTIESTFKSTSFES